MHCLCYRAVWFCLWQSWRRLVYRWCLCAIGTLFPEDVNPMSNQIVAQTGYGLLNDFFQCHL